MYLKSTGTILGMPSKLYCILQSVEGEVLQLGLRHKQAYMAYTSEDKYTTLEDTQHTQNTLPKNPVHQDFLSICHQSLYIITDFTDRRIC